MILSKLPSYNNKAGMALINNMVKMANLTRNGFNAGDITCLMSPRTLINWAENHLIFQGLAKSFTYSFLNKCEISEREIIAEYYQRVFAVEL
jgi:cobaltochelatase CobS